MGFSHLLNTNAILPNFKVVYDILKDVKVAYCHEGDIVLQRCPHVVFFPLMAILEGGVRFLMDPLILRTLRFYGLCLDQLPPNFYRVVGCVSRLSQLYGLQLDHHDINFMYSLCGNIKSDNYLKVREVWVRLISYLSNSNRNSVGEYIWVSGNRHANELTCRTSPRDVGRYRAHLTLFVIFLYSSLVLFKFTNQSSFYFSVEGKRFKPNIRVVHVRDLNFVLRSEIFINFDGQLQSSHLILGCTPVYSTWQLSSKLFWWMTAFCHTSTYSIQISFLQI